MFVFSAKVKFLNSLSPLREGCIPQAFFVPAEMTVLDLSDMLLDMLDMHCIAASGT
jgi:hypothetical protein